MLPSEEGQDINTLTIGIFDTLTACLNKIEPLVDNVNDLMTRLRDDLTEDNKEDYQAHVLCPPHVALG